MDYVVEFSEDATTSVTGKLMDMYGKILDGKNNLNLGPKLMNKMKALTGTLKNGGSVLSVVGGTLGYYDDVNNNDKTKGQAIAHNGAAIAASTGAGAGTGALAGLALASGPAGWIGVGVGVGVGYAFKKAYDNNFLGLQDGLDWTGDRLSDAGNWTVDRLSDTGDWAGDRIEDAQEQLDNARDWAGDQINDAADDVGEAVSGGLDAINPFSS